MQAFPITGEAAISEASVTADVVEAQAPEREPDLLLPSDPQSFFLAGLFLLALLAAFYVASDIVLPLVLAIVLKMLLNPAVRFSERLHVPRALGALLVMALLVCGVIGFGMALSGPATSWAGKLPTAFPLLEDRLGFLREPIAVVQRFLDKAQHVAEGPNTPAAVVTVQSGSSLAGTLLASTRAFAGTTFTTLLILYFLLLSGDTFLRRLVEILPRFSDKRQAVEIVQQIERDISAYLVTITLMNLAVGAATAVMAWIFGMADPLLWGAVAFVLNYVPLLGPVIGGGVLTLAGLLSFASLTWMLVPALVYFGIHLVESQVVTPLLLAKRFTLNPVLVVLTLVFWYWMWGVPGAMLGVPMLAIIKIVCDRIRPLGAIGHFIGG